MLPLALPPSSDLAFYNWVSLGAGATQARYANNRYFPRAQPTRCASPSFCPQAETSGPSVATGSWRSGGLEPDLLRADRMHEDGDIHAGNGNPDANGNPTWLIGGSGIGVPMPGSKGYRNVEVWSYRYGSVAHWVTQDTVLIDEWNGGAEHNKNRRGMTAYGETTDPTLVPSTGSALYQGTIRGRYAPNGIDEPVPIAGDVVVTVNFATRTVQVTLENVVNTTSGAAVPVNLTATVSLRTGGEANYLAGSAGNATMSGGLGARLFGPVTTGGSGAAPAELGGVFSMSNGTSQAVVLGGFIARKQ